jgi:uncharacterized membrane protein (UPF0127 family)
MKNTYTKLAIILSVIVLTAFGCNINKQAPYTTELKVKETSIYVEVVNTPEKITLGLSGREKFKENQGMLFDFNPQLTTETAKAAGIRPNFWMKDMKFDLDIIWIKDKKIVGITKNVPKPSPGQRNQDLPLYPAPQPIDMVLEVLAGWSDENKVEIGDEISLQ